MIIFFQIIPYTSHLSSGQYDRADSGISALPPGQVLSVEVQGTWARVQDGGDTRPPERGHAAARGEGHEVQVGEYPGHEHLVRALGHQAAYHRSITA